MGEIKRGYFLLNKQQDNIIKHIFDRNTLPSQGIASAWEYPSLVGVPLVVILHVYLHGMRSHLPRKKSWQTLEEENYKSANCVQNI